MIVTFTAPLWVWDSRKTETWTFVSLPPDASDEIRELVEPMPRRGFGAVRVRVRLGDSRWATSIFPGGDGGAYVLPVKKAVRRAEELEPGDTATITVELVDF